MAQTLDQHLRAAELFPPGKPPIHVNRPRHAAGHTPLHDHDFFEIAVVEHGHALHRDVHGSQPIAAHALILVQPGQWHAYEGCRDLRLTNVTFARGLLGRELAWAVEDGHLAPLLAPQAAIRVLARRSADLIELRRHLDGLVELLEDEAAAPVALVARLLLVLSEIARQLPPTDGGDARLPESLRVCLLALEQDLARTWSLSELARLADCDASYLNRLWRRHLGSSPLAWLLRRRCERAAVRLLTTSEPVGAIGAAVGFSDPNYFARRFRAAFGRTPRDYRQQLPVPARQGLAEDWVQW
jgi:AraC family transcriptional regulator, L-rhamnose operon transcriptional activator RhaR